MRAATSLPPHKPLHLLLAFAAAGLTTLTSCGEKQITTIGGENTDAASTSLDSDTSASSDSLGKRLGVAMPSTAVNFTQIPAQDPNAADIVAFSGSRDGSILAVRTPDSILILNGSDLATKSEIPADFLTRAPDEYFIKAGKNFVFDLQSVPAANTGVLKWMMDTYRVTSGHANYGKRESRALLNLPDNDIILDVQCHNDQVVILTRNADRGPVRLHAFDSSGKLLKSMNVAAATSGTVVKKLAAIIGVANGRSVEEYWLYGPNDKPGSSTINRLSTEGTLLGKYSVPGAYIRGVGSTTTGPLKILAWVGSIAADGSVPQISTYSFPFQAPASGLSASPFSTSTLMASTPAMNDLSSGELFEILGDRILRIEFKAIISDSGGARLQPKILNQSGNSVLRTFSGGPASSYDLYIVALSGASTMTDVLAFNIEFRLKSDTGEYVTARAVTRIQGAQTIPVTGLPLESDFFSSDHLAGTVIPGPPGQNEIKVLVVSKPYLTTTSLGIITLPANGGAAGFSGPYQVNGVEPEVIYNEIAVSSINGMVTAYLAGYDAGGDDAIRGVDLTPVLTNPGRTEPLTSSAIVNITSIDGAIRFNGLTVKDNFLFGFILQYGQDGYRGTLMSLSLATPAATPVYAETTSPVAGRLPGNIDLYWTDKIKVATETDAAGRTVPYAYSTLVDGSILEMRMNNQKSALTDLKYWLRPEGGRFKFGPVPDRWVLSGDMFYGMALSDYIVTATKAQLRSSYVQSPTLTSEFLGAKQQLNPSLKRGSRLRAGVYWERIGLDPRRVKSGASFVDCPGFEAKVLPSGNFVVEKTQPGRPPERVWSAITGGGKPVPGSFLDFGANGRIALLDPAGRVKWNAVTAGMGAMSLNMQRDGNLVAYDTRQKPAKPVWDSRGCLLGKCNAANALVPKVCEK